ncbi:GNAT family N-acetyltransferase [uncultured Pseudokineococcus sp.]|uniref:GNAT family N-acetyltransferase n=1 Tax=uncultured Pseudokineococcus sp. TaxID=1642928 RepID=UPI00262D9CA4|nr:GNAT family protein [uncultured Pseudokineococcus sp.]
MGTEPGDPAAGPAWTTARLVGRAPTPADAAAVLALHRAPGVVAHDPGDALADLAAAQRRVERWARHWHEHGTGYALLSWRGPGAADGTVVGVCGTAVMTLHDRPVLNLLYRLHPAARGRGVATEAATAVVARARRSPLRLPVTARVRPANSASARVALAAGLERDPELDVCGEDGPEEVYRADVEMEPGVTGRRSC